VYSQYGNNFVKTMLKLMQEKEELGIICDQIGSPTWAKGLAQACLHATTNKVVGIHHWTDSGVASWYDFAIAIQNIAFEQGKLNKKIEIKPITTDQYPTPAKRPKYSVLDKNSLKGSFIEVKKHHWIKQLDSLIRKLK
jgi:dTDP-4-dehydrorhamnose reductase